MHVFTFHRLCLFFLPNLLKGRTQTCTKPGIAVLKDQILVSDSWLHSVFMFDFDGVMKSRFGFCGTGHSNLMTPKGIAVGKECVLPCIRQRKKFDVGAYF